jgi:hypothetical protein
MGEPDRKAAIHAERQGWEPVPAGDEPKDLTEPPIVFGTWSLTPALDPAKGGFQNGFRLYRMPQAQALDRSKYYRTLNDVKNSYLTDSHALMPKFVGEEKEFYPEPEDVEGRIKWALNRRTAEDFQRASLDRAYAMKGMTRDERLAYLRSVITDRPNIHSVLKQYVPSK